VIHPVFFGLIQSVNQYSHPHLWVMTTEEIHFLQECLDLRQKTFYYFKDKYALQLLSYYIKDELPIGQLKKSALGFLLDKPLLKTLTAHSGTGTLTRQALRDYWPEKPLILKLSLGCWGKSHKKKHSNWHQTSRPGQSLVLRLNFSHHHNKAYQNLLRPVDSYQPFSNLGHPSDPTQYTLAWVRLDLDWETGEVLIEEIQNDWLRNAQYEYDWLMRSYQRNKHKVHQDWLFNQFDTSLGRLSRYYQEVLKPYERIWDEAALSAAIWFIREELGLERIFYHTFETGNQIKGIKTDFPPRSLYTQLPRRFGFQETDEIPQFLREVRHVRKLAQTHDLRWYRLDLSDQG